MKKLINALLILTSLVGYLEWGEGNQSFFFQVEYDLLFGSIGTADSFSHPLIFIPLIGQLLLLITLFQKTPNNWMSVIGLICLSLIMYFLLFVGVLSSNMHIVLSAVPFTLVSFWFYQHRYALLKLKQHKGEL